MKRPDGEFRRNFIMKLSEIDQFREKWKNRGVYTTAYRYDQTNIREANLYGNLYLDFDIADLDNDNFDFVRQDAIRTCAMFTAIFGLKNEQIEIYFSGKKGVHLIIPALILGIEPRKDLHEIFRTIALDISQMLKHKTLDTGIYDNVRLFRLPNSIHPDTNNYKIPLTYLELRSLSFEEIEEMAQRSRQLTWEAPRYNPKAFRVYQSYIEKYQTEVKKLSDKKGIRTLDFMPFCIKNILHQECAEGTRNKTCAVLAHYFKSRGNSQEEALEKLLRWNEKRCSPMLREGEVRRTLKSIYDNDYHYGCRSYSELGGCDPNCKLYKKRR